MKHIFRAYDIRGIWNRDIDPRICLDIGRGLGTFLKRDLGMKGVAVGYDVRTSSEAFNGALIAGLLSTGVNVLSVGECSFGIAMFAGWKEGMDASCYITASHLEPQWNGLKIYFGDGVGFPEEHIKAIRNIVLSGDFLKMDWKDMGEYTEGSFRERYVEFWEKRYRHVIGDRGLGIGVDCGGGAMCHSAPFVLSACGVDAEPVNCDIDPFFRNRPSEPTPDNLGQLRKRVIDKNLAFGIAFDGDGDRAVFVDDRGRFMTTDRLGIIIARYLVREKGGGLILANVESSMAIEDILVPLGAEVKRIKVGHTFLTLEAKENGAIFGVERSGHLIVPEHVLFDDAMVAPLEVLRIISGEGRKLSEIVDEIPQYPNEARAFGCRDDVKFRVLDSLSKDLSGEYERVNLQDGVRVDMDEGWVLIRCSNTSPVIRITVEARDEEEKKMIMERFASLITDRIGKMGGQPVTDSQPSSPRNS